VPLIEGGSTAVQEPARGTAADQRALPEWLAAIAATAPGVVYSFRLRADGRTSFPYAGPGLKDLAGVDAEDLVEDGSVGLALVHSADIGRVRAHIEESASNLTPWRIAFRLNHADKGEIWLEGHSIPHREADGSVLWYGFLTDITERREAEKALRASEDRFRLLFESSPFPILEADFSTAKALLDELRASQDGGLRSFFEAHPAEVQRLATLIGVLDVNQEGLRFLGARSKDDVCRHVPDYLVDESRPVWADCLLALAEGASLFERECAIRTTRGEVKDVLARLRAAPGHEGTLSRVFVSLIGLDERQQVERALRESETMSALGALVAGVAHEVRNPLFAISATLDAFEARFGTEDAQRRYVALLRGEVDRLSHLMQELLDYGRPPRLQAAEASLVGVFDQAVEACAPLAAHRGVVLRIDVPEDLPCLVMDRRRLEQAFQNLIENAVHHAPAGSLVEVRARSDENGWIESRVEDAGPGFREEDLRAAFEPFFTRRRGGTGLGLSIVRRVVTQHGGHVFAANRPEGGGVVTVRLPATGERDR
jgi:PAS domain S-box-containing protein